MRCRTCNIELRDWEDGYCDTCNCELRWESMERTEDDDGCDSDDE